MVGSREGYRERQINRLNRCLWFKVHQMAYKSNYPPPHICPRSLGIRPPPRGCLGLQSERGEAGAFKEAEAG